MTRKTHRTPKVTKHVVLGENLQKKKEKEKKKEVVEETKTGVAKIRPANNRYQQPSREEMITAWDKCLLAKFKPGTINAPIVAGMNVSPFPTLVARTSGTEAQADLYGSGM